VSVGAARFVFLLSNGWMISRREQEMQGTMGNGAGLSKARLDRMHDIMSRHVENGSMPGLVTLVSRHGEVHFDAIGALALGGAPMQRDTIFRIASMTSRSRPRPP